MPLHQCPHMAARCPHYNLDCQDQQSKHCHYITNTTGTVISTLATLESVAFDGEKFRSQIEMLSNFLQETKNKQN